MKFYKYFLYGVTFLTLPAAFSVFLYFNEKVFINNLTKELVSDISDNVLVNVENTIKNFVNINSLSAFVAEREDDFELWRSSALSLHIQNPYIDFAWLKLIKNGNEGRLKAEQESSEYWNGELKTNKTYTFQYVPGDKIFEIRNIPYNNTDNTSEYWVLWNAFPMSQINLINLDFLSTRIKEKILNIQNGIYDTIITDPFFVRLNNRTNIRVISKNIYTIGSSVNHISLSYIPIDAIGNKTCENLLPGLSVNIFSDKGLYMYGCKKTEKDKFITYLQSGVGEEQFYTKNEIKKNFYNELSTISQIQVSDNVEWTITVVPSNNFKVSSIVEIIIPVSILLIIFVEILIIYLLYRERRESKKIVQNVINVETQLMKHICHEVLNPLHSVKYYISISKCKCNVDLINENLVRMSEVIDSYKHNDNKIDIHKKCNIATIIRDITSQIENLKIRIHENVWCDFITYPYIIKRFLIYIFLIYKPFDFLHFEANIKNSKLIIEIKLKSKPKNLDFHDFNKTLKKVEGEIIKERKTIRFRLPVQLIEENV